MTDQENKKKVKEYMDYIGKRVSLVASRNYTQLLPYFIKLLRKTRLPFLKKSPFWLGVLQLAMLRSLSKFYKELAETRAKLRSAGLSQDDIDDLEHRVLIQQEWIRVFQTITDGVAWRVLEFNRPIIRLLSENNAPGPIDEGYAKILGRFVSSWSDIVLVNDITRCLRIGDITRIRKGKILLYELKENGRIVQGINQIFEKTKKHGAAFIFGDNRLARQRRRQWTAQMSIANRSIDVPMISKDGSIKNLHRAEIIDSTIQISTHLSAIKKLIKKVNKSGFEQQELEEGYFVEITAWDKVGLNVHGPNVDPLVQKIKNARSNRPAWCNDRSIKSMDLSNLESFHTEAGQYTRNFTPQSVLPFSANDCVRLMMGCLEIKVFLNLAYLKKRLEVAGWTVEEVNHDTFPKKPMVDLSGEFLAEVPREAFYKLSKSDENGTYRTVIPLTLIIFALSTYYKIDFILDVINEGFGRGQQEMPQRRNLALNFIHEKDVLI